MTFFDDSKQQSIKLSLKQREQVNNERMPSLLCKVSHNMYAVDAVKQECRWDFQLTFNIKWLGHSWLPLVFSPVLCPQHWRKYCDKSVDIRSLLRLAAEHQESRCLVYAEPASSDSDQTQYHGHQTMWTQRSPSHDQSMYYNNKTYNKINLNIWSQHEPCLKLLHKMTCHLTFSHRELKSAISKYHDVSL